MCFFVKQQMHLCLRGWRATVDFVFVVVWPMQVHGCSIPVQRVDGVGVGKQLREERLKDVGEVW